VPSATMDNPFFTGQDPDHKFINACCPFTLLHRTKQ